MIVRDFVDVYIYRKSLEERESSIIAYSNLELLLEIYSKKNYRDCNSVISKEKIHISKTPSGKPYIKNGVLHFNISYSEEIYIIAISNHEVGVDVEKVSVSVNVDLIVKKYFSEEEKKYMNVGKNKYLRIRRFYELWTRREAFVKYLGTGITNDFKFLDLSKKIKGLNIESFFYGNYVISICVPDKIEHINVID